MKTGWEIKKLGDVCQIVCGGTPSKANDDFYKGKILWATIRDMKFDILSETEHRITEQAIKSSATNIIPKGNVVIATRVGLGKVCLLENDTAINQDLRGVIPKYKGKLSEKYLFFWFKSIAHLIEQAGTGATVHGVKLPFVKSLEIPVPPLPEQRRIVSIFDEAFAGIAAAKENAEQNLKNAKEVFESYIESIFNNKEWKSSSLSELCNIKHGFAFKSEFFSSNGDYVVLTPGNFYESGGYRDRGEKQKYYSGEIPEKFVLKKGDLLVAMTEQAAGLLGSPIVVPESDKYLHNQRLGLVEGKNNIPWLNEFFFHVFNTKSVRKEIHDSASGVKVRHTSPDKIGNVVVSFPTSISEQSKIVSDLHNISAETSNLESSYQQKLSNLEELKKSLLQQAFSGAL